jgi:ketosteroid isomerase-like protein
MSENNNIEVVKAGYADFLQGNVAGVLGRFAEQFEFTVLGAPEVPYAGTSRNREELAGFFKGLDEHVAITVFEPREYFAAGDRVVTLGHYGGHVKQNGHPFSADWAMVWTVRDGKVEAMQELVDPTELKKGFVA